MAKRAITNRQAFSIMSAAKPFKFTEEQARKVFSTAKQASEFLSVVLNGDFGHADNIFRHSCTEAGVDLPSVAYGDFHASMKAEQARILKRQADAEHATPDEAGADESPTPRKREAGTPDAAAIVQAIAGKLAVLNERMQSDIMESVGELAELATPAAAPALPPIPHGAQSDYIRPAYFDEVYTLIEGGLDVLLFGPAGTGKSRTGAEIGKAMEKQGGTFAFRAGMSRADLFYSKEIRDNETVYTLAPLLEEVQRPVVTVIDEVFSLDPEELLGLNGLFEASTRCIDTPLGTIARHPEHRFILTSNTDGRETDNKYHGPQVQDASTLSRVVPYAVDYDEEVERSVMLNLLPDAHDIALFILRNSHALRRYCKQAQLDVDISTRNMIQAAQLAGRGFTPSRAFKLAVFDRLNVSERYRAASVVELDETAQTPLTR